MDPAIITLIVLASVAFLFVTEYIPIAVAALSGTIVLAFCGQLKNNAHFRRYHNIFSKTTKTSRRRR